jgi:hypothetical protein
VSGLEVALRPDGNGWANKLINMQTQTELFEKDSKTNENPCKCGLYPLIERISDENGAGMWKIACNCGRIVTRYTLSSALLEFNPRERTASDD